MGLEEVVGVKLPTLQGANDKRMYCYGAHDISWTATDDWGAKRTCTQRFYATDLGYDLIIGLPALHREGVCIDYGSMEWRYGLRKSKHTILSLKDFERAIRSYDCVYSLIATPSKIKGEAGVPSQLREFQDVFSKESAKKLPPLKAGDHAIELMEGKDPPYGPIYNLSTKELEELRSYLDNALENGHIQHSVSPAGAPILFVPKKDGGLRLCVDYRGLNKVTTKNRHPLPLITETLDRLCGAKKFTKLDLKDAYHRIRIKEGDEWKTAFRTRYGHFEYLVMPFGLANAPATFQAYINRALAGLVDVFCVVYLDDILIYSNSEEEHWEHVKQVLSRLRKFELFVNLDKCAFDTKELEFLGYIVSTDGVKMDPGRVTSISEWPQPKTHRDVQVFLGFANFYRRFIYQYSKIAAPLTDLLKGAKQGKKTEPLEWSSTAHSAFVELRDVFTRAPLLAHFDPSWRIKVETDASGFGIAAILSQLNPVEGAWHPVAFWSRKMAPAEQNYETHDQELLAIVKCFEQWRHYLEGAQETVEVLSDHDNLRGFMNVKSLNARQRRWVMKLAAVDFEISHRAGSTNPADPPSRRPDYQGDNPDAFSMLPTLQQKLSLSSRNSSAPVALRAIRDRFEHRSNARSSGNTPPEGDSSGRKYVESSSRTMEPRVRRPADPRMVDDAGIAECTQQLPRSVAKQIAAGETAYNDTTEPVSLTISRLQEEDAFSQSKIEEIGDEPAGPWSTNNKGVLLYKGKLYVPNDAAFREELLAKYHDDPLAGHFGVERTLALLQRNYRWPDMKEEINIYVKTCEICQRTKIRRHRPYGKLESLPIPSEPWEEIAMDFITGFPPSTTMYGVFDSILVVVCRYTKMAVYIPVRKTITAAVLATLFINRIVCKFGMPKGIVTDRGSLFTSNFWSEFCYMLKIKRKLSTAFHPQTDGQTERQNQSLEQYLRAFSNDRQDNWASLLPLAEFAYNNSVHSTTKMTPFFMLYGYHPKAETIEDDGSKGKVPAARERAMQWEEKRKQLVEHWREVQNESGKHYDKKHKPQEYNVGDWVLLSTKNLRLRRPSRKLSPRYCGPYKVVDVFGKQAYKLQLPEGSRIHPVFHVSLLEPWNGRDNQQVQDTLPELLDDEEEYEVESIVGHDTRKQGKQQKEWYLVRWAGYPPEYDQWMPEDELSNARGAIDDFKKTNLAPRKRGRPPRGL